MNFCRQSNTRDERIDMELSTHVTVYIVKIFRMLTLLMVFYVVERVYLERYITRVFIEDKKPQSIVPFIFLCIVVESVGFITVFATLFAIKLKYDTPHNAFILDGGVIMAVLLDYAISTVLIINLGVVVASVIQNAHLFRYSHDGLRGIRANSSVMLGVSVVLLSVPFHMLM